MDIKDFSMEMFSLKGKNAVITGGNTGLGRAFSLALVKAGADIMTPSVMPDDPEFRSMVEAEGQKAVYMEGDITQEGVPGKVVQRCLEELGSLDILVNCAGIVRVNDFPEFSRADWDPMMAINLTGAFEMSREAAFPMIKQGSGKIINIASMFSFLGGRQSPAYAASKHGIAGLTKALCDEMASSNIQVNAIAPGYFKTKVAEAAMNDPERNRWIVDHTPAGRWGDTADLMGAAVYLASRASQFVNGHVLAVDGGFLTR